MIVKVPMRGLATCFLEFDIVDTCPSCYSRYITHQVDLEAIKVG